MNLKIESVLHAPDAARSAKNLTSKARDYASAKSTTDANQLQDSPWQASTKFENQIFQ
jgi:hypothetical protein